MKQAVSYGLVGLMGVLAGVFAMTIYDSPYTNSGSQMAFETQKTNLNNVVPFDAAKLEADKQKHIAQQEADNAVAQQGVSFDCKQVMSIPVKQCQNLVDIYNSTNGPSWTDQKGWFSNNDPCSWGGTVGCYDFDKKLNRYHVNALYLSNNNLQGTVDFTNLPSLKIVYLYDNKLTSIVGLNKVLKLETLSVERNELTSIWGLEKLYFLKALTLNSNKLTSLPSLKFLNKLERLDIANNKIASLDGIDKLVNLNTLDVSRNELAFVPSLQKLNKLTNAYLANNKLTTLPDLSPALQSFYIYNNKICDLKGNIDHDNFAFSPQDTTACGQPSAGKDPNSVDPNSLIYVNPALNNNGAYSNNGPNAVNPGNTPTNNGGGTINPGNNGGNTNNGGSTVNPGGNTNNGGGTVNPGNNGGNTNGVNPGNTNGQFDLELKGGKTILNQVNNTSAMIAYSFKVVNNGPDLSPTATLRVKVDGFAFVNAPGATQNGNEYTWTVSQIQANGAAGFPLQGVSNIAGPSVIAELCDYGVDSDSTACNALTSPNEDDQVKM